MCLFGVNVAFDKGRGIAMVLQCTSGTVTFDCALVQDCGKIPNLATECRRRVDFSLCYASMWGTTPH